MSEFMGYYEKMVDSFVDGVLATNEEMVMHMKIAGWKAPLYNISGLAFGKDEVRGRVLGPLKPFEERTMRVAFSARWDQEKQPDFYMDLIEAFYSRSNKKIEFCVFSGSKLKSNNESYMERTRKLQSEGKLVIYEDLEKNEQYKKRNEFNQQIRKAIDRRSFLTSIEMEVEAHMLAPDNLRRAEQLSLKTNQFNLRKQRYSSSEIQQMKSSGQSVMELVSLRDRFGDHGIIAMYGLTKIEDDVFFINTFLLSCRAIGREIEFWIMNRIRSKCVELQGHNLYAEYVKTDKNQIAHNFLENQGFMKVNEDNVIFQKLKKHQFEIDGTLYRIKLE
jgi:predicted enzyme involved in methoxymalonyl-ACP biosynthesis